MSDQTTSVPEGVPSAALLDAARRLADNSEIVDVRPVRILASFEEGGPDARVESANIEVAPGYISQPGMFSNKFEFRIRLEGADSQLIARFEFDLIVDYRVEEGFEAGDGAADFVTGTTGYFAAYPYARELLQSMSARLRMDPIVLGFLRRGPGGEMETLDVGVLSRPARLG